MSWQTFMKITSPPLIMGIINVTPDSFSGDGLATDRDFVARALLQAEQMIEEGAAILDIGGESSRPGATPISLEEELRRVVPVVTTIRKRFDTIPIAVDTVKSTVAEQALQQGATIINDITALAGDARMGEMVARHKAQVVLMHNRASATAINRDAKIGDQYQAPDYENFIEDVVQGLRDSVDVALKAGIARDKIILDPGLGFGKTPLQNLFLLAKLDRIKALGFPILIGPSRKSFIGHLLDLPIDERLEGTAACIAWGTFLGAAILRVHDVKSMARVAQMASFLREASLSH